VERVTQRCRLEPDPGEPPAITGTDAMTDDPGLEIFPVGIGIYDFHKHLDVDQSVRDLVDILREFSATEKTWPTPMADRGADAVDARLRAWGRPAAHADSVLYWVGHGWSDGFDVSLAHARSPAAVHTSGLTPGGLAEPIRSRQSLTADRWAVVVVDTCWSARFVDKVNAFLAEGPVGADAVLLVGTSGDGATSLGRFQSVFRACLNESFRADRVISLWQLARELDRRLPNGLVVTRRLGDAALRRRAVPVAGSLSMPLDVLNELEDVLGRLSDHERRHFLGRAQSAEDGEVSWFFEGRETERQQIVDWLRTVAGGLLVITGSAGSGKSALLGHMLMQSLPDLREILVRMGLVELLPEGQRPRDNVFDQVIHLVGLTLHDLAVRLAEAAHLGELPSDAEPMAGHGTASDLDWLVEGLRTIPKPFTLMLDALDEVDDPLAVARTVVRRIAAVPGIRLVVGSRSSTKESPDHPTTDDDDLLDALGVRRVFSADSSTAVVRLRPDPAAVQRYVMRQFEVTRERGRLVVNGLPATGAMISAAAQAIAGRNREFLFARLAVHEVLAEASLLSRARLGTFHRLLAGDHRNLFAAAVDRLDRAADSYLLLLRALALSRGRGLPITDGLWSLMANALAEGTDRGQLVTDADVSQFLVDAQPYIAVDVEGGQTVYRLAHRTFVEHFLAEGRAGDGPQSHAWRDWQRCISRALTRATTGAPAGHANPYLVKYLSGHVGDSGDWTLLAKSPEALSHIDPDAVTADVLRTVTGLARMPPEIAGVIGMRHNISAADYEDRAGLRQLGSALYTRQHVFADSTPAPWSVAAASIGSPSLHVRLAGHVGDVNSLCIFDGPNNTELLASAGDDGSIRLWNPATADPVGVPLHGHTGPIQSICVVTGPQGQSLLASAGSDGTVRLWDLISGVPFGAALTGHVGTVWDVCAVSGSQDEPLIASAGSDGTIRLWDFVNSRAVGGPLAGHTGTVWDLCQVADASGRRCLVSAGTDGTIRLWSLKTYSQVGPAMTGHDGPVMSICPVTTAGGQTLLASAGCDGTVRLWEPFQGRQVREPSTGHAGAVWEVCTLTDRHGKIILISAGVDGTVQGWQFDTGKSNGVPLLGHRGPVWKVSPLPTAPNRTRFASAGADGTVRLWDTATVNTPVDSQDDPIGPVWKVAAVPRRDGTSRIATAGNNGRVRLWDPVTATAAEDPMSGHAGPVAAVCSVPLADRETLVASAGTDSTIRLWDAEGRSACKRVLTGHRGTVTAICAVPVRGHTLLVSGGDDATIRVWDPLTGKPRLMLTGHVGTIRELCPVLGSGGRPLVASVGDDSTIRLWDPELGEAFGEPMTGHAGPVEGVCAVPWPDGRMMLASCGDDATVRLWDPALAVAIRPPLRGHAGAVRGLCSMTTADGRPLLASGGDDATVRLWDPLAGTALGTPLTGHAATVRAMCGVQVPDQGVRLVSVSDDGSVRLWDALSGHAVGPAMYDNHNTVGAIATFPSSGGRPLHALAGQGGQLRLWDPATAGTMRRRTAHRGGISAVSIVRNRSGAPAVVTGGADGTIRLTYPQAEASFSVGASPVLAMCALPGPPSLVAVASGDGTLTSWDLAARWRVRGPAPGHPGPLRAVTVIGGGDGSPAQLVSGGQDGLIRAWDIESWLPTRKPVAAHTGWLWSVCTLMRVEKRTVLASAGADALVRLWDAATLEPLGPALAGHHDQVRAVCSVVTAQGRVLLASGSQDETIRLWDPATGTLLYRIPLGIPVYALQQILLATPPDANARAGAELIVGTRDGVLAINLSQMLLDDAGPDTRSGRLG
jgi:WD40 repeat protein